jgi:hypothetical protein
MNLLYIGVDVATTKLAFASINSTGELSDRVIQLVAGVRGARRDMGAAIATRRLLAPVDAMGNGTIACIGVEVPVGQGTELPGLGRVVAAAAQEAVPAATVFHVNVGTWKKSTVGAGNATKDMVARHAAELGYVGDDQDVADALCVAEHVRGLWVRSTREAA